MLNDQLGHDLPGVSCGRVGVVRAVDLQHVGPGHDLLGFAGVYEGSYHVDVSVQNVVLGILVSAVDALFGEHDRDVGACYAGDVGVIVDGSADFILDQVQGLSLGSDLLSGDGDAADALRRTFHQAVDVGLAHVADDHQMVRTVPCSHSHTADVVLKTAGSDLGRNGGHGLGIDAFEVLGGRKGNALLHGLGNVMVMEGSHIQIFRGLSPGPASSSGFIFVEVFQQLDYVKLFIGL